MLKSLRTGLFSLFVTLALPASLSADLIFLSGNILNQQSGPVNFDTDNDNTIEVVMSQEGNLGIGNTSPTQQLHVTGNALITGNLTTNGNLSLTDQILLANGSASAPSLAFTGNTTSGLFYDGGNVEFATAGTSRMIIDPNGNVGIGTNAPNRPLKVAGIIETDSTLIAGQITMDGTRTIAPNTGNTKINIYPLTRSSSGNQIEIGNANNSITTGDNEESATMSLTTIYNQTGDANSTDLHIRRTHTALSSGNNYFIEAYADASRNFSVEQSGNLYVASGIGIGSLSPTAALDVNGSAVFAGSITPSANATHDLGSASLAWNNVYTDDLTMISDTRLKTQIAKSPYGLEEILSLKPVTFKWKSKPERPNKTIGFLAQEVEQVMKEVVFTGKDERQTKGVQYVNIIPVLVRAIQQQQVQIEIQNKEIRELKKRVR